MMIQIHCFRLLISSMVVVDMIVLHALILIVRIPFVKPSQELLRNDSNGITWDRAQDECEPYGLENREEYLREIGIPNEQEFWIGKAIYRAPTRWIEIIGCFQIAENHTHSFPAVESIGYCQHECYSKNMGRYFGYKKLVKDTQTHNCVCLSNEMDERQQRAIQYCVNSRHFFVYRDYNGTVGISSDPGICTTICCGNCKAITANVNNLEGRRCSSENSTIVGRCGTIQNSASTIFKWGLNYYDSLNHCMTRNALLPSSNYCQKIETTSDFKGQLSWTNVFREEIEILQMKDFDGQPQRCFSGIFIQVKGHTILNMTEQQCSGNKNYYVCKTNKEVKTQIPLFTHNKGMTEDVSTSPDLLSSHEKEKSSYQSTASLYSTETVLHNGQREKGNNSILTGVTCTVIFLFLNENCDTSIGAVIGGITSACFILAVIAALIACKISSKGICIESNTFEKGETSQLHFSNTINQDSTYTRKRKVNDLCETGASEYSVVNNLVYQEKMNATYTDAADGEYDVLHDKHNRTMCMTENMYHSHGVHLNEDGPTYDSAAIVKGNHNGINGLYDTSFSVIEGDYSYMSYKGHDHSMTTDIYDKSIL